MDAQLRVCIDMFLQEPDSLAFAQAALAPALQDTRTRKTYLTTISERCYSAFRATSISPYLRKAISLLQILVDTDLHSPPYSSRPTDLGGMLAQKFGLFEDSDDPMKSLSTSEMLPSCPTKKVIEPKPLLPSFSRSLTSCSSHTGTKSIERMSTEREFEQEHALKNMPGMSALASTAALRGGKGDEHALDILEAGRGITAGLIMDARSDLSELAAAYRDSL
ncbi:uncharacterized protein Z519_03928 [Cladophialophora bantiana CBS 173.52]|uniref:Uncharacterized protein n=1 Tax=Cladophialophora bantiana (strain ATCC 10958 / CBS 173.52 / CDC B-1940 / NIH 8579) TaxID=1442370 RepID=A0A0D2IEY6_CLAB1|nr:uncharacterized protein Z519_03928 [Cladophialophora bantiana CBS 173.52]KIW95344.1 hypothetical protein Z519_03928 [Cladophialophora bantiana CBS 173.52]